VRTARRCSVAPAACSLSTIRTPSTHDPCLPRAPRHGARAPRPHRLLHPPVRNGRQHARPAHRPHAGGQGPLRVSLPSSIQGIWGMHTGNIATRVRQRFARRQQRLGQPYNPVRPFVRWASPSAPNALQTRTAGTCSRWVRNPISPRASLQLTCSRQQRELVCTGPAPTAATPRRPPPLPPPNPGPRRPRPSTAAFRAIPPGSATPPGCRRIRSPRLPTHRRCRRCLTPAR
jgi:hypothetical protein